MQGVWILKFAIVCSMFSLVSGLPPEWTKLISHVCVEFNDSQPSPPNIIRNPQCITTLKKLIHTPLAFLLPPLILWSPLEQFRGIIHGQICCPKCDGNIPLHPVGWRDGTNGERSEPRKIHGCDGVTLLVGRVYECTNKHEVLAYHPDIIKQIPGSFIPFKLWHITGFTMECIELVVALMSAGMSINYVRNVLEQKQLSFFYTQRTKFMHIISASNQELTALFPNVPAWRQHFSAPLPSNHSLASSFLADFWSKESIYIQCMQTTTVDDDNLWLSLDHTFSSASECV